MIRTIHSASPSPSPIISYTNIPVTEKPVLCQMPCMLHTFSLSVPEKDGDGGRRQRQAWEAWQAWGGDMKNDKKKKKNRRKQW